MIQNNLDYNKHLHNRRISFSNKNKYFFMSQYSKHLDLSENQYVHK